jgi:bacteriorhodopsin
MYTLAVFFLVVAVLSLTFLVLVVKANNFKPKQLLNLAFILGFTILRSTHFFLVASNYNSEIGDYILDVLPTFFYFSAFLQLVQAW